MIGPIKGHKLKLSNEKLKCASSDPEKKRRKTPLKVNASKSAQEIQTNVVEYGTCKYCYKLMPLRNMKEHYLTHKINTDTNSKETENNSEGGAKAMKERALQENFISSTRTVGKMCEQKSKERKNTENDICESSKYFDNELYEEKRSNVCFKFIICFE